MWPENDKHPDPTIVKQLSPTLCLPACGEIVFRDRGLRSIDQNAIYRECMGGQRYRKDDKVTEEQLANALTSLDKRRRTWYGLAIDNAKFQHDLLACERSWIAVLKDFGMPRHAVVIDPRTNPNRVYIRDPADQKSYWMNTEDFFKYWTCAFVTDEGFGGLLADVTSTA